MDVDLIIKTISKLALIYITGSEDHMCNMHMDIIRMKRIINTSIHILIRYKKDMTTVHLFSNLQCESTMRIQNNMGISKWNFISPKLHYLQNTAWLLWSMLNCTLILFWQLIHFINYYPSFQGKPSKGWRLARRWSTSVKWSPPKLANCLSSCWKEEYVNVWRMDRPRGNRHGSSKKKGS